MKSRLLLIFGVILVSNIITFTMVKLYFPTNVNNNNYLLKMKGQGELWTITDYQFAWVSDKGAVQGSEIVTYLGNPDELSGNITVEMYDYFKDGTVPHHIANRNVNDLRNGSFKAGGGGAYPDNNLSVKDIVKKTYVLIRWTTSDGKQHKETIQMELDYDSLFIDHIL